MGRIFGLFLLLSIMSIVIAWSFSMTGQQQTPQDTKATPTQVTTAPPQPTTTPIGKRSNNIVVRTPGENEDVGRRFVVTGEARVFENVVSYRVKNQKNNEVYVTGNTMADSPDVGQFGPFTITVILPDSIASIESGDVLLLEVFQASAKDGSDADKVTIPLKFRVGE